MAYTSPKGLHFDLASDPDTKYLHAEVYFNDYSICDVDTEKGGFSVSFSADPRINPGHESISLNLSGFARTLERAKEELLKHYNRINDPL
ncbi:hypothetical protein GCM10023172_41450 [Hymenobacter ginsengisoli]|uniref:DUF3467 domain-containing protein n=1 Tax=Hymenobacter ginsengisoli TaxID=1051626 RepID=A0ABP8QQK1_9BACT